MVIKLYVICDFAPLVGRNLSIEDFCALVPKETTTLLQYRDKLSPLPIQKHNIEYLQKHFGLPVIINDHLSLLEIADGLHLGQEDLATLKNERFKIKDTRLVFELLRKKYPNKIFGLSTHNELEILEANRLALDYIGLGAYRDTRTKDVSVVLGERISYLAKISKHPVGAIGGVRKDDLITNITYNVISGDLYED